MAVEALLHTHCPTLTLIATGKVRDIYAVPGHPEALLFVATDRVSAFDVSMLNGIPGKGKLLTALSLFFFHYLANAPATRHIPNHVITSAIDEMPVAVHEYKAQLQGRAIWVKTAKVLPVEAIVRGYITGSAWAEYKKSGTMHGIQLPVGLQESSRFTPSIFTPSTKAEAGSKDENIHPDQLASILHGDADLSNRLRDYAVLLYTTVAQHCESVGIILADTKMEFGLLGPSSELILVDECFTPDSSRFWASEEYGEGNHMIGLDKQYLRQYLLSLPAEEWNGKDGVLLPSDVVDNTMNRYKEAYSKLTGKDFV